MKVLAHIEAFLKDEEGASGIEYALVAGMAALAITASSGAIKKGITDIMAKVAGVLTTLAS